MKTAGRISANQISQILNMNARSIRRLSVKENWPCIEAPNPSGGGIQKLFKVSDLPAEIQDTVLFHLYPPEPKEIDENKLSSDVEILRKKPERVKNRATARLQIIEENEAFCRSNGYKQTHGEKIFMALYAARQAPGIDEETYELEKSCSATSLRKWRKAYEKSGFVGLLTNYKTKKGPQLESSDAILTALRAQFAQKPNLRKSNAFKIIVKLFPDNPPSRKTIDRYIDILKKENPGLFALMENPSGWKNSFQPAFGNASAGVYYFGQVWEMDGTRADFRLEDGSRLYVICVMDVFSRKIMLFLFTTNDANALAVASKIVLMEWGMPDLIKKDNGSDYQSRRIKTAYDALGIKTPKLRVHAPEQMDLILLKGGQMNKNKEIRTAIFCIPLRLKALLKIEDVQISQPLEPLVSESFNNSAFPSATNLHNLQRGAFRPCRQAYPYPLHF